MHNFSLPFHSHFYPFNDQVRLDIAREYSQPGNDNHEKTHKLSWWGFINQESIFVGNLEEATLTLPQTGTKRCQRSVQFCNFALESFCFDIPLRHVVRRRYSRET